MQALLTHYSLETEPFLSILTRPHVLLTGSAALWIYLQEQGADPGFQPANLDLYIAMPEAHHHGSFLSFLQNADLGIVFRYLLGRGYNSVPEEAGSEGAEEVKEAPEEAEERAITLTMVRDHCRIRLLALRVPDLVEYVCSHADLSPCMTWWNPTLGHCETVHPERTLRRGMRRTNVLVSHAARIQKYESRGFTLESDPTAIHMLDPRAEAGALEGCRAYDVIGLEEVDAAEWLQASSWNILVRVQDSFHAFDRRALSRCMQDKSTAVPRYAIVYDTPHHQSVCEEALDYLLFGDWSVYELQLEHTITYGFANDRQKSVYRMICYTVEQYVMGDAGVILAPPPYTGAGAAVVAANAEMADLPPLLLIREHYSSSSESESDEEDPAVVAAERRHSVHRWEQRPLER